jgi:alpha-beta hydrolase superfamily lysophospholipase
MRTGVTIALVAAIAVTVAVAGYDLRRAGGDARQCRAQFLSVSLAQDRPATAQVAVRYCEPRRWATPRTVDVLTDGATYNQYWDWPEPRSYSAVDRILADGRATVTYDRVGTGRSGRLPSTAVTVSTDAWVLEQILRWLAPKRYHRIISWVHSYGAAVGIEQAANLGWTRVDQLVITGFIHAPRDPAVADRIHPANQDHPRWRGLDDGWLTTKAGTRGRSYHGPATPPAMLQADEARKDVISQTAFDGFAKQHAAPADTNPSARVTAPVIIAIGDQDAIFCTRFACSDPAAVRGLEASYYRAAATLTVIVAPGGHSLALEPSTDDTYHRIGRALAQPANAQ